MSTMGKLELLPNEIFIECFQYLNAPDIFHSFDRLNYRFYTLIRNSPLHLNFLQFKKSLFNEFCQIILSNPEIKHKIISLYLSNEGTHGQIQSFLSLFSVTEFIHLRSLSLIDISNYNAKQILSMLPFLSNLYYLSCTCEEFKPLKIIRALSKSKVKILTISTFDFNLRSIYKTMSIISLTIVNCLLSTLFHLFKSLPMLKYLKIENLFNNEFMDDDMNIIKANAVYLKQLIVDSSEVKFEELKVLLKHTPNLKIFSISSSNEMEMTDAIQWQHLIESSLPYLHTFKFILEYPSNQSYDEKLIKFKQFQTDFWHKKHHWYTNYEINEVFVSIYTMPYAWNEFSLISSMKTFSYSNEFDNVKNVSLSTRAIRDHSSYYFKYVQSLRLISECDETDKYELETTKIKFLHMIVNVSNISHLTIEDECYMTSTLLLEILKELPNVSSLKINKQILIPFLTNLQLCEYFNRKIITLDISSNRNDRYIPSNDIDLFCKTFSNLEQLHCFIRKLDDLLLMLTKLSKLSILKMEGVSNQIYSWIKINQSILNIYLDPVTKDYSGDDNM